MRRQRRELPTEVYFVTVRTVEQRFALSPYASPGAWHEAESKFFDCDEKEAMSARGRASVNATAALTREIARCERNKRRVRPRIPIATFTDSIPNIIGACMARGIKLFGVELYGFVWMSNHGHLLLRAPKGNLAEFMGYLNGQIAVNANRFLGRENQLWSRRYSAIHVLDEPAELEMLGYLLANPQRACLANSIDEWPGLSSAPFFFQNKAQRFVRFDRTAWSNHGRPDDISPFLSTVKLKHALLPQLSGFSEHELRRTLRQQIEAHIEPSLSTMRKAPTSTEVASPIQPRHLPRSVMPTDRPLSARRGSIKHTRQQPLCITTKPSLRKLYREWYRDFRIAYAESSKRYRQGDTQVEFPPGSFAPSKYPKARYPSAPDTIPKMHPTRKNLEFADAFVALTTQSERIAVVWCSM